MRVVCVCVCVCVCVYVCVCKYHPIVCVLCVYHGVCMCVCVPRERGCALLARAYAREHRVRVCVRARVCVCAQQ